MYVGAAAADQFAILLPEYLRTTTIEPLSHGLLLKTTCLCESSSHSAMPLLKIFHLALEKEPLLGEKTFVCKYLHSRNILVKEVLCGMIAASMPSIMSHIEGLEPFWSLGVLYLGDYVGMMHSRSDI